MLTAVSESQIPSTGARLGIGHELVTATILGLLASLESSRCVPQPTALKSEWICYSVSWGLSELVPKPGEVPVPERFKEVSHAAGCIIEWIHI